MKRIVKLETPPTTEGPDGPVLAGGYIDLGGGYYDVEDRVVLDDESTIVASGDMRYYELPEEHIPNVLHAFVHRDKDELAHLRNACNQAVNGNLPAKKPAKPKNPNKPPHPKDIEVLEEAQRRVSENSAFSKRVRMVEVLDGDVVELSLMVPHLWLGEVDTLPEDLPDILPAPSKKRK